MASLAILVTHSGKWDDTNRYIDYTIEGIVFKEQSMFLEFYTTIATQICVDMNNKILKIEYKVEESNKRMVIHNDMGVRVYVMLKKVNIDFNKFSICITILDSCDRQICQCQGLSYGEMGVLATVAENNSHGMIVAESEETNVAFVSLDVTGVISDESNKHVEVDQVYRDRSILKAVMERYAIEERFQYRTARSNSIRKKALKSLRGTPAGSYAKLPAYLSMMDITYPGSRIRMKKSINNEFLYLFVQLNTFIQGFMHCRALVVGDGSHLRGPYNRTFVAASTTYGARHIFPLAYGIVDSKNDAAWTWFFEQLKEAYGERSNMCIVSDINESIIKAVTNV
ncbi:uncharacterized protein LOC107021343 [Solanum pennellii]|uniref:Uncharacterized protein LOC107021343 n=1 Tax=Solanum pennellii TaxID=28526 RepID=A0ABM1GXT7_SOLPN|nr:uncharacterized protein LOC107021343 [Solanum pennellii]